jgi:hypothetical protein
MLLPPLSLIKFARAPNERPYNIPIYFHQNYTARRGRSEACEAVVNDDTVRRQSRRGTEHRSARPRPTHAALPRTVSGFKRFCNKEIGENIWQDSYYDRIIRGHKDFENHWNYISKNPHLWILGKDEI